WGRDLLRPAQERLCGRPRRNRRPANARPGAARQRGLLLHQRAVGGLHAGPREAGAAVAHAAGVSV
nr:hypothetical protein [Tanacetum cinerariifolium]